MEKSVGKDEARRRATSARATSSCDLDSRGRENGRSRSNDALLSMLTSSGIRKASGKNDDIVEYNHFDFIERMNELNKSDEVAEDLWLLARQGMYPPYYPSHARGERTVAKLNPRVVRNSTMNWAETQNLRRQPVQQSCARVVLHPSRRGPLSRGAWTTRQSTSSATRSRP